MNQELDPLEVDVPTTVAARNDPNTQIVDCRERDEWDAVHIDGTIFMPLDTLGQRMGELDRQRPVIAICRSGRRSLIAAQQLTVSLDELFSLATARQDDARENVRVNRIAAPVVGPARAEDGMVHRSDLPLISTVEGSATIRQRDVEQRAVPVTDDDGLYPYLSCGIVKATRRHPLEIGIAGPLVPAAGRQPCVEQLEFGWTEFGMVQEGHSPNAR